MERLLSGGLSINLSSRRSSSQQSRERLTGKPVDITALGSALDGNRSQSRARLLDVLADRAESSWADDSRASGGYDVGGGQPAGISSLRLRPPAAEPPMMQVERWRQQTQQQQQQQLPANKSTMHRSFMPTLSLVNSTEMVSDYPPFLSTVSAVPAATPANGGRRALASVLGSPRAMHHASLSS